MKLIRLILGLVGGLVTYSCQQTQKTTEQKADGIIRDTITNKDGVRLVMAFDNANHTARFVVKGEVIELKQDTLASGINYSNPVYEFREHQGEGLLKKRGNVLFSFKK